MSALQVFAFDSHAVRSVTKDGEPWFVANDVTKALEIDRTQTRRLDDDERGVYSIHTPSGEQEMTVISESGLYSLVLGCRKPEAKKFKKWVTAEVLPAIRQTGSYSAPNAMASDRGEQILDTLVRLLERSEAREERLMSLMERLLPAPGQTRRKGKTMYAADMARIKAMRATGATLEDMVAATGFSQTQVSYVIGDQVRIKPDGRVVTVHRYAQALAQHKANGQAPTQSEMEI